MPELLLAQSEKQYVEALAKADPQTGVVKILQSLGPKRKRVSVAIQFRNPCRESRSPTIVNGAVPDLRINSFELLKFIKLQEFYSCDVVRGSVLKQMNLCMCGFAEFTI